MTIFYIFVYVVTILCTLAFIYFVAIKRSEVEKPEYEEIETDISYMKIVNAYCYDKQMTCGIKLRSQNGDISRICENCRLMKGKAK